VTATPHSRAEIIGDTAIAVLAAQGARGLTHRAVDRAAGLPPGSTSNHARTREALLTCALTRITELEAADAAATSSGTDGATDGRAMIEAGADGLAALAGPIAAILHRGLSRGRTRLLARYELALESTRRPALRALYDEASQPFRGPAAAMLAAAGSAEPQRHAKMLIAWCEGVQFDAVAGAGAATPPGEAELRAGLEELLRGMLGTGREPGAT
jgi:DNA-binding transcriptional regulator YbjK